MTVTLSTILEVRIDAYAQKTLAMSTPTDRLQRVLTLALGSGSEYGEAELLYHGRRSLSAEQTEVLDLQGGLASSFGDSLSFSAIKILIVHNPNEIGDLVVGGSSNSFPGPMGSATNTIRVRPLATLVLVMDPEGYPVTSGSKHLAIKLDSSQSGYCDLIIVGV